MARIGAVYFTRGDVTGKLMRALLDEVECLGIDTFFHEIKGSEIIEGRFRCPEVFQSLKDCDAIVFGTPTYMGGVSAQFKAFADASGNLWAGQEWANKIAAGLTCGTALNGDQSSTLHYLVTLASQHGMLWVNLDSAHGHDDKGVNRLGCQLGVVAQSRGKVAHATDLATARYLGRRLGEIALRLSGR